MASTDISRQIRPVRTRSYLNKDFAGLRADILGYMKTFYSDRIKDFSEAGVGGMFLDMASYVGDVMTFYLDHQFNELDAETAVESKNIERLVRSAGVPIAGASPAVVVCEFYIEIPAEKANEKWQPMAAALPLISQGSTFKASNGTIFEMTASLDFSARLSSGDLLAQVKIGSVSSDGSPASYILMLPCICISGTTTSQSFTFSSIFQPFQKITLAQENITEIISVLDTDGNTYYEVDSLTQDTVFVGLVNVNYDNELVSENLEIMPAPYRFTKATSVQTGLTSLQFGSGNASTLDDDIVPDPSDLAIPLYGKQNFPRFSLDPASILSTRTLGISPCATTITVTYRYGGGLSHNVPARSIRSPFSLKMSFPGSPDNSIATKVRSSLDVINPDLARGGEPAPTLDDLRASIPAARNAQSRIVTREDLLARIYTMPSNFGRVFRAGVHSNSNNPLATQVFIISRDSTGKLIVSPDTLKKNLRKYLNQFRLISDAVDILDASAINFQVEFKIATLPNINKNTCVQSVISSLTTYFNIKNAQIDKPIMISEIINIIINQTGVVSLVDLKFRNIVGQQLGKQYSSLKYNLTSNTIKGLIIPPAGAIFELKYPDVDVIGNAV